MYAGRFVIRSYYKFDSALRNIYEGWRPIYA